MAIRRVAGLISGTSMDGLDLAVVDVEIGHPETFTFVAGTTKPFPEALQARLRAALGANLAELAYLDDDLGRFLEHALSEFAAEASLQIDLIGSHGQTVFHDHGRTTLQIGEPGHMAKAFGCPVVSDFRRNDIVAGGCGAPLVPILDKWALASPDAGVLALNLGGIANFTALPPRLSGQKVIAFDTGPANMVADGLVRHFTKNAQMYDKEGEIASKGVVSEALLDRLMRNPYFRDPPPKSCGDVEFGPQFVQNLLDRVKPQCDQDWFDLIATAVELSARSIADAYREFVTDRVSVAMVAASGGGVRNPVLMRRLGVHFDPIPIRSSHELGLDPDFKEAIAFALMACARLDRIPANVPEVTGATRAVLLGRITEFD